MIMKLHPLPAALLLAFSTSAAIASTSGVVISQVYGGGGNSGAPLKNDFIELLNAGAAPVSLAGWSVQYNSSTGTGTWQVTTLGNVSLAPGQYYLVQEAAGTGGGDSLPPPDAIGTIAMSSTSGKVALLSNSDALVGAQPSSAALVDLIGYGTANYFEGGAPAPGLSNTTADQRGATGCTDTDQNGVDFATAAPAPRNSASPTSSCQISGPTARTIPEIQGSGSSSAFVGQSVRTGGVVTLLTNTGFYLQDPSGDGNSATSDGILVYTGSAPTVQVGDLLQLVGTVAEYNTGAGSNADTAAHTVTELTGISAVQVLAQGQTIAPTVITLPELVNDDLERYEGMLVRIDGPLTVSQNYFLGRYGQLTLSAGGRMQTPTNAYRPGSPEALALADQNARSRIILDDASSQQNPNPTPYLAPDNTVRAGDTVASITGVVDYGLATSSNAGAGDYKLQPTELVVFSRDNPRTEAPRPVPGNIKLASFNVLNFFTTFTDGTTADGQSGQGCQLGDSNSPANCRGASNLAEFNRQQAKIVEALAAINADAIGLMEMQNNGEVAVGHLVAALNQRVGAGTYAAVSSPVEGTGTDAIKVAMVYKPGVLQPVGAARSDLDPVNNRPTLAQTFAAANGQTFTVLVNHLKSKGSCPAPGDSDYEGNADIGDGQGCWNAHRVSQAQRLASWINDIGATRAVLLGDFNAYAQEDPIVTLRQAGLVDQIGRFNRFGYSYVFDGAAGRLDHGLSTASLSAQVTAAQEWHINADEPAVIDYNTEFKQPLCPTCGPDYYSATAYRSSDHDPVVMGLYLLTTVTGTAGRDTLVGTPGDDLIIGGGKGDVLTGNGGANVFSYSSLDDARDTITDFVPGWDRIDLRALLASIGYTGTDPVADGVVRLKDSAQGAKLQVKDGVSGKKGFKTLLVMSGVSAAQIDPARDLIVVDLPAALKH
jgi:uncharacterized protein